MRPLILSITLLLILAPVSSPLLACDDWNTLKEEVIKEYTLSPGGRLILENSVGEIEITGWDEPRVEIVAVKKVRYKDSRERARELLKQIDIEIRQTGNEIKIETNIPEDYDLGGGWTIGKLIRLGKIVKNEKFGGVTFKIKLPRRTDLNLEQSVGELEVDGVTGEIKIDNSVGELALVNISGPAEISSGVGKITLHLTEDAAVDIDASCGVGDIDCSLPLEVEGKFVSKSLQGQVNGGGPRIRLDIGVGEITIEKDE